MVSKLNPALILDAWRKVLTNPTLFLTAFALLLAEAGCNAQAGSYPDGQHVDLGEGGNSAWVDAEDLGMDLDNSMLYIHDSTVLVADGIAYVAGERNATGAEAVGAVLGTWAAAIPIALVLLVIGAWLLPGYYRRQRGDGRDVSLVKPGTTLFRRVLAVRAMCAALLAAAGVVSATPGIILLTVADLAESPALAMFGVVTCVGAVLAAWLHVHLGLLFADREAVLQDVGARVAIRQSWSRARGRRLRRLVWALSAWFIEALGTLGWLAWFVGFATHPIARALSDTMLTSLYLDEVSHA